MYWYVLFVRAGREKRVEKILSDRLNTEVFIPFVPMLETIFKTAGILKKELKPLFPSYVFIESEMSSQEFMENISSLIHDYSDIVRLLKYSDNEISLRESERLMLMSLYNDNNCIESSSGIIEGDKIHIIDGPLRGRESIVKQVNRHKREAKIEIEFLGHIRLIKISLEIIEKL